MILSVDEARDLFPAGTTDEAIRGLLDAVEGVIRAYTNNNFQVRAARFEAASAGAVLAGASPYIVPGDTVQITESGVNDGLYTVESVTDSTTELCREMFAVPHNLVTKVAYPPEVKACARNLLSWEAQNRGKVGVKSETLSRKSVTYFDQDANNQAMGYPVSLLGALAPYRKARF